MPTPGPRFLHTYLIHSASGEVYFVLRVLHANKLHFNVLDLRHMHQQVCNNNNNIINIIAPRRMAYTGCPLNAHRLGAHWRIAEFVLFQCIISSYFNLFAIGYIRMHARMIIDRILNR